MTNRSLPPQFLCILFSITFPGNLRSFVNKSLQINWILQESFLAGRWCFVCWSRLNLLCMSRLRYQYMSAHLPPVVKPCAPHFKGDHSGRWSCHPYSSCDQIFTWANQWFSTQVRFLQHKDHCHFRGSQLVTSVLLGLLHPIRIPNFMSVKEAERIGVYADWACARIKTFELS